MQYFKKLDCRLCESLADYPEYYKKLTSIPDNNYELWRMDDNGNEFMIKNKLFKTEANSMLIDFENSMHKQTYWIKKSRTMGRT